jgi:hypothetical protein
MLSINFNLFKDSLNEIVKKYAHDFFQAWQIDDPSGKFWYYISKN